MDNRLVLTVLFVTLSWMFVGICAQNTTAQTTVSNTGNDTTAAPTHNATAGNDTTAAPTHNATAGNNTTGNNTAGNNTAGNNTTGNNTAGNNTAGNNTTGNNTAGNNTTAAPTHSAAAGNNTAGNNTTAATTAGTTTAAPLTPNITVEVLATPVSRAECGSSQLCAAQPADCDPSQSGSCFFLAAKQTSGRNFEFGLSGESTGYIAASLSTDTTVGGNDTTYVCANDNGAVKFFSTVLNNGQLIVTTLSVNSVKGRVNGSQIQCTFAATVPAAAATRRQGFSLSVSSGTFDSATGTLGAPTSVIRTGVVDLTNPNATVTNELATGTTNTTSTTTTSPATTSHAVTLQQSLMQALLVTVGVLGLAML